MTLSPLHFSQLTASAPVPTIRCFAQYVPVSSSSCCAWHSSDLAVRFQNSNFHLTPTLNILTSTTLYTVYTLHLSLYRHESHFQLGIVSGLLFPPNQPSSQPTRLPALGSGSRTPLLFHACNMNTDPLSTPRRMHAVTTTAAKLKVWAGVVLAQSHSTYATSYPPVGTWTAMPAHSLLYRVTYNLEVDTHSCRAGQGRGICTCSIGQKPDSRQSTCNAHTTRIDLFLLGEDIALSAHVHSCPSSSPLLAT